MSKKIIADTKENIGIIDNLYNIENMNMEKIAMKFKTTVSVVSRYMKRNNIESRTSGATQYLQISKKDMKNIIKYYIEDNLSTEDISILYDVDRKTIANHLIKEGIIPGDIYKEKITDKEQNRRDSMIKLNISDDELIDLYCNQKLQAEDIARMFNVSRGAVLPRLAKLNIHIRTMKEILNENIDYRILHIKRMKDGITEESLKKTKLTNIKRYGVDNPFKSQVFQDKANATRNRNGSQSTSYQQEYLNQVLHGTSNYLYSRSYLDIAFPDEMIYIEYDGGGHDLSVKLGSITQENFDKRENRRSFYLRGKKWKEIRIISIEDKLPTEKKIIEMIEFAKEYLSLGHHFIKFDIDNSKIINSKGKFDYDFGNLRGIHKNDIIDSSQAS